MKCLSCGFVEGGPPKERRPKKSIPLSVELGEALKHALNQNQEGGF